MVWLYVVGMEDWNSPPSRSLIDSKPFVMWRGKPMSPQELLKECEKGGFIQLHCGLMYDRSQANTFLEKWISSWQVFPASHIQKQGNLEQKTTPETSGHRLLTSLGFYDPLLCSWKTYQTSLTHTSGISLETFPSWGMMRRGVLYELPKSEPPIKEKGGSFWRNFGTPRTSDAWTSKMNLRTVAAEGLKNGKWTGLDLIHTAKLLPKPIPRKPATIMVEDLGKSGILNPQWIGWLMGLPIGWIKSECSETESCHSKQNTL